MPCPLYHRIVRMKNFLIQFLFFSKGSALVNCYAGAMLANRKVFLFLISSYTNCVIFFGQKYVYADENEVLSAVFF